MERDKGHNMKVIVNTRILASETKNMCIKYFKDSNKKLEKLTEKIDKLFSTKNDNDSKIKELDDIYSNK